MSNKDTDNSKEYFDKLYTYVKKEVLKYDDNQSLSKYCVLRLKGLRNGKFIENKKQEDIASYSYKLILVTFQLFNNELQESFTKINFKDEQHKINYIFKIIESKLNDTYLKIKEKQKSETIIQKNLEDRKKIEERINSHKGVEYRKKTKDLKNKRLDNLW